MVKRSRRDDLHNTKAQMKLFTAIATAAVIGTSFMAANPAEARSGWIRGGCDYDNDCNYVKVLNRSNYSAVKYKFNGKYMWTKVVHCLNWATRFVNDDGSRDPWRDVMPGSVGEAAVEVVCR